MHRGMSVDKRAANVKNPMEGLKRLLAYLKPFRIQLILVAFLVLVATGLSVLWPYLVGVTIDRAIVQLDWNELLRMVLILLGIFLLTWLIRVIYGQIMANTSQKIMRNMRQALFDHMQMLSIGYYDKQTAGDLLSRLTNDMDAINALLSQNLTNFIQSLGSIVGVLVMMIVLDLRLTLAALVIIPLMLFATTFVMKRSRPAFQGLQKSLGQLNSMIEEDLGGHKVVIAYGQQGRTLNEFKVKNTEAKEAGIKANILAGVMPPVMGMLSNLNVIIVVSVGAYLLIRGIGGVTIGTIAAFAEYTRRFSHPLNQIANLFNSMMAALAGAERIFEVLDVEPGVADVPGASALETIKGEVQFEGVTFGYQDEPVLRDINLHAQPGKTMALVGPTGAGKTTIINLLTRFYDVDDGRILIDGQDLREIKQNDLRRNLGIVLQDTFLFADTVMENIRYGRLDANDDEVIEAAKLANADGFIRRMPEGYHTELSERGSNLSQGQRQLLSIARAILADPAILILDEATSSVDTRTEVEIQKALLKLMEGRTSFVIAHRLSTIRNADQILVINEGELIERGTHQALLDQKGFYYNLYTSQFKGLPVSA